MKWGPCRSCNSPAIAPFYVATGVPVQSSIVLDSREAALAVPRGDIVLGLCPECGFVSNLAHPESVQIPDADYEDQQGFSPTFSSFAAGLAGGLVERYGLRGGRVVEIGCGKGDFLALLCGLAGCEGIGIDPLFRRDRLESDAAARITAVPELYDESHAGLMADFRPDLVLCRHTLEHIPDVARFLGTLRTTLDATPVVFEVPDLTRILEEAAFWDVYYEHCSYFSPGSLARAFRAAGFTVDDVRREYRDQYLVVHARATDVASMEPLDLEEAASDLSTRVESFTARAGALREQWRERARARPALWGSGSKCVAFISTLGIADNVACVVDINPHRHDRYMPGLDRPIVAPAALRELRPGSIIAMNPVYRDEIEATVKSMGLDACVMAV